MPFTLVFGVLAFTLLYATLVTARLRLAEFDEGREERELERAIERATCAVPPSRRDGARLMDHNWGYVAAGYGIVVGRRSPRTRRWLWQRLPVVRDDRWSTRPTDASCAGRIAALVCVGAAIWMLVHPAEQRRVLRAGLRRRSRPRREQGDRAVQDERRGRARQHRATRRRRRHVRAHRRRRDRAGVASPAARPTSSTTARRWSSQGNWDGATLRVGSAADQARQRLRAAERADGRGVPGRARQCEPMKAAIGYGALTVGAAASVLGIATIGARPRTGDGRAACAPVAATCSSRSSPRSPRSRRWSGRCSPTTSRSRTSPTTSRARRPACTRSPRRGPRSRVRSCCGCSRSPAYLAVTVWRFRARADDPLVAWATIVGLGVALFFFALTLGPANPFQEIAGAVPLDGRGPNPLLQNHPLVAFHPPMLYLGFVGFTIPFSFAVARARSPAGSARAGSPTCGARRSSRGASSRSASSSARGGATRCSAGAATGAGTRSRTRRCCRGSPGTAFIHSVMVQERRGMLRVWNLSLVLATFCLTILGTFLTRSGVVTSVHSFTQSPIGPWLLTFLGVVAIGCVALIAWRGDALRAPGRIDSPVSREAAFLLNNLLFAGFALVVLTGTVFPLLAEALQDRTLSVGEPYFERLGAPIGIALLFLMAVGPLLPWRAASGELLRERLLDPGVGRRHHARRRARARRRRRRAGAHVRTRRVRAREHRAHDRASVCGRAAARTRRAIPVATLRAWCARTRGCTAGSSCTSGSSSSRSRSRRRRATRRGARSSSSPVQSATVRGYTVTYLGSEIERERAEDDGQGARRGWRGAATTSACTRPRSRRSRTSRAASARRRCAPACCKTCTSRSSRRRPQTGEVTLARADQPDGAVAVDRRRHHGARHAARAAARAPTAGAPDAAAECRRARRVPKRRAGRGRDVESATRRRCAGSRSRSGAVVVVLGVVLALNVSSERSQRHRRPVHRLERIRRPRSRSRRSTATERLAGRPARARPSS